MSSGEDVVVRREGLSDQMTGGAVGHGRSQSEIQAAKGSRLEARPPTADGQWGDAAALGGQARSVPSPGMSELHGEHGQRQPVSCGRHLC